MSSESVEVMNERRLASNKAFRFLDLPAEIRNNIYTQVAQEAYLRAINKGKLASRSAMPRVSSQIRSEFLANLYMTADIVANVDDFDFAHIVTFFNRLSDAELKALSRTDAQVGQAQRQMTVILNIMDPRTDRLRRWINRTASGTKKGAGIDLLYIVDESESMSYERREQEADFLERWKVFFHDEKKLAELEKIIVALEESTQPEFSWPEIR